MVDIADILSPQGVIVDLKACNSKRQVLKELATHAAAMIDADAQQLLEALMERERLGTTGVGHGIAIPHARLDKLDKVVGPVRAGSISRSTSRRWTISPRT